MNRSSTNIAKLRKKKPVGTKDQFARDDPAFLVLLSLSLLFSSVFYSIALNLSTWGFVKFFLWSVFIDCIAVGVVIATVLW